MLNIFLSGNTKGEYQVSKVQLTMTGFDLRQIGKLRLFLITYCEGLIIELNIATTKIINVAFCSNDRCFLLRLDMIMPKNPPEMQHSK